MRSLVTGGAGFIGSHLIEELSARGDDVLAVDSFNDYYDPDRKRENARELDIVELDLETADLELLIRSVDRVFHLAGQPGVRKSFGASFELYVRRNVLVTARVFEAAAQHGIRVVYASSSSVYGDAEAYPTPEEAQPHPISPYGVTKRCCEDLAYAYTSTAGLDAVGLRYFTVYGPRQRPDMAFTRMLEALASGDGFPLYGDGSASRSFTYVDDAVAGTIAAMERGKAAVYNIGGGEEARMTDVFALAERISGRNLRIERRDAAAGDVRRTRADGTRAAADLGWAPSTPLDQGLAEHWKWVADRMAVR